MFRSAGITQKGFEMIAEAVSGKQLTFTRMEYGDGINVGLQSIVSDEETLQKYREEIKKNPLMSEEEILNLLRTEKTDFDTKTLFLDVTELVSKKADIGMYEIKTDSGITTLTGKVIDSSVVKDFRARELGVFAKIDDGEEFLFAYFSAVDYLAGEINDSSDFISISALLGQEQVVIVNVATGSATNINMQYNINIYATKKEFDEAVTNIRTLISDEVSKIIADAPERFDTLKEISDWLISHEESAADMNSNIVKNAKDISAIQEKLKGIEESGDASIFTLVFDMVYPKGYVYKQYPGCPSPIEMGFRGEWKNISDQFAGLFDRIEGGAAETFNKQLTVSSVSGTTVVFTEAHGLTTGSLIVDLATNEQRGIASITNDTTVVLESAFTSLAADANVLILQNSGLPNIKGTFRSAINAYRNGAIDGTGAFSGTTGAIDGSATGTNFVKETFVSFNASRSNSIYGKSNTVQPTNTTVRLWKRIS